MKIQYEDKSFLELNICDLSFLIYLCVLFAHQNENNIGFLLRIGSLAFVCGVHLLKYITDKEVEFFHTTFAIWLLALMAYGALSCLWSLDTSNVFYVLKNILKVSLVCILLLPRMKSLEDIRRMLFIFFLALCYMLVILVIRTPVSAWGTERVGQVINQHSNTIGRLANYGLLFGFFFLTDQKKYRPVLILLMAAFMFCVLMTGSKNAIFMMIFQMGLYYFLISGNWKRILVVAIIVIGSAFLFWLIMNIQTLYQLVGLRMERMLAIFSASKRNVDGSTWERLYYMKQAWKLFKQNPVLGIGMNNFSAYLKSIFYSNAKYSHCGFLEVLSTLGITGFILYYSMYIGVILKLIKNAFKQEKMIAFLFTIITMIFVFDITTLSIYEYFNYILLLLAFCAAEMINAGSKLKIEYGLE